MSSFGSYFLMFEFIQSKFNESNEQMVYGTSDHTNQIKFLLWGKKNLMEILKEQSFAFITFDSINGINQLICNKFN